MLQLRLRVTNPHAYVQLPGDLHDINVNTFFSKYFQISQSKLKFFLKYSFLNKFAIKTDLKILTNTSSLDYMAYDRTFFFKIESNLPYLSKYIFQGLFRKAQMSAWEIASNWCLYEIFTNYIFLFSTITQ